jgi:hypothetical protein
MSKLRDRIRDMSRRRVAAFGFAAMRSEERAPRQLLVVAEVGDAAAASSAAEAGADVVLHGGALDALAGAAGAAGSAVVGQVLEAATAEEASAALEAGAHFIVFNDERTDAAALLNPKLGYVGMLEAEEDADLRLLRALDLDAVIVPQPAERMNVRDQLRLRRMGELTRKPMIARLNERVGATTLEVWRDAGVVAVLVPAGSGILGEVIAAADAVPRPRESSERPEVTVPTVQAHIDEDDDD